MKVAELKEQNLPRSYQFFILKALKEMCDAYVCTYAYTVDIWAEGAGDWGEVSGMFSDTTSMRLCLAAMLGSADVGHSAAVFLIGLRTLCSLSSACLLSQQRRRPVMYF